MTVDKALMLQIVEAAGASRAVYLSVPLTSGLRDVQVRAELGDGASGVLWEQLVMSANKREAWVYAELSRTNFPGHVVIDPSVLDQPSWDQNDYNSFWASLIEVAVSALLVAPGWAFSRGARSEVDLALRLQLPVMSVDGVPLSRGELAGADRIAREELARRSIPADYLTPMPSLAGEVPAPYAEPPAFRACAELIGWLRGERPYQVAKFGTQADDEHTRRGLGDDSWWWQQLTNYLGRARMLGVGSDLGRQALAKFAATTLGLAESVLRLFGPLSEETRDDPLPVDWVRHGREEEAVFRWLVGQRAHAFRSGAVELEDAWIQGGLGDDSPWWHHTMRNLRQVQRFPLTSATGRRLVGRLVGDACGLCEAVLRGFGGLPAPGVSSGARRLPGGDD